MKFLIDENLPPALAAWLRTDGFDAIHVSERNLLGATDQAILNAALAEGRIIVTRDNDFDALSQPPSAPKVMKLGIGNCRNAELRAWFGPRFNKAVEALRTEPFVFVV